VYVIPSGSNTLFVVNSRGDIPLTRLTISPSGVKPRTDPYTRWCGKGQRATATPMPILPTTLKLERSGLRPPSQRIVFGEPRNSDRPRIQGNPTPARHH
jgi:hypothetical protein